MTRKNSVLLFQRPVQLEPQQPTNNNTKGLVLFGKGNSAANVSAEPYTNANIYLIEIVGFLGILESIGVAEQWTGRFLVVFALLIA